MSVTPDLAVSAKTASPTRPLLKRALMSLAMGVGAWVSLVAASSGAWAVTADELRGVWASGSGRVSSTDWREMIAVFQEDAETNAILTDIQRRLGASNVEGIARIIELCPELQGNTQGHFAHQTRTFSRAQMSETVTSDFGAEARALRPRGIESRVERLPTVDRLTVATVEKVCMRPGLNLLDAFGVMVHELTHFRGWQALREIDVLDYRDEHEFAEREVLEAGGELEAYTAQGRALCRLAQRSGVTSRDTVTRYFDSDCQLSDRSGLIRNILDTRGYRQKFEEEFRDSVAREKAHVAEQITWHQERLLPMAENNARVRGREAFNLEYIERIRAEIVRLEDRARELDRRFPRL